MFVYHILARGAADECFMPHTTETSALLAMEIVACIVLLGRTAKVYKVKA